MKKRLRIAKLAVEEGKAKKFLAYTEGYSRDTIRNWVNQYLKYGEEGLKVKKRKSKYTQKIKDQYLASVEVDGLTVMAASRKFNIPQQAFYEWKKERDSSLPIEVRQVKKINKEKQTREELLRLKNENKRLKMKIEVLKKLQASTLN